MNNMRNKILMTLALLITAVGGAWATEYDIKQMQVGDVIQVGDVLTIPNGSTEAAVDFDGKRLWLSVGDTRSWTLKRGTADKTTSYPETSVVAADGEDFVFDNGTNVKGRTEMYSPSVTYGSIPYNDSGLKVTATDFSDDIAPKITVEAAAPALEVIPGEAANTWTFTMPTYDVELTPIYAPKAKFATDGNLVLTPTAAEGIIAGTEDAIVNAGTVVEGQGTAMYFATTDAEMTAEKAAAADGWLSTLPTAAGYDDATTVYVWYYIKGADTPQGQTATAENTFNDSEICETPIKVTVLSNKFDIEFKAANANTIEAGKATVKVGETAAEVKEGKLTGVKMDSKVTITAKDGYKFRKVEGKKTEALKTINIEGVELKYADGDTWETIVSRNSDKLTISNGGNIYYGDKCLVIKISDWESEQVFPNQNVDPNANYCWAN